MADASLAAGHRLVTDSTLAPDLMQMQLAAELHSGNWPFVDGIGQHPGPAWPGEPSFLVFGLGLERANTVCTRWQQNASVWSGADAPLRLIVLR